MFKWIVFLPIISIFILSKFILSVYVDRFFIFISPFFYILTVLAIRDLNNQIFKKTLSYALTILILISLVFYYTGLNEESYHPKNISGYWYRMHTGVIFKHPYRNVARFLYNNCGDGDFVLCSNRDIHRPLQYYFRYVFKSERNNKLLKDVNLKAVCVSAILRLGNFDNNKYLRDLKECREDFIVIDEEKLPDWNKKGIRYWLLSSKWNRGQEFWPRENQTLVREFMIKNYKRIRTYTIDGIIIDVFEIR